MSLSLENCDLNLVKANCLYYYETENTAILRGLLTEDSMRGGGRVTLEVGELLPSARSIGQSRLLQLSLPRKTNIRQTSQHGKQIQTYPES